MRLTWRTLAWGLLGSLVLLALWFRPDPPSPAWAQGVGIFSRQTCNQWTSPTTGQSFCFEQGSNALKFWNGATWTQSNATQTGINNVRDYGARGDGTTDDTTAIQAAITAASAGSVVFFPPGQYVFSSLSITTPITLQGSGWTSTTNAAFGNAAWTVQANSGGTVLRPTAPTATAVTMNHATQAQAYHVRDLAVIGPGSGTAVGLGLGSDPTASVQSDWRNVLVANFATGVRLANVEDATFTALRLRGNTTGLQIRASTNQNVFINLESQFATDGVQMAHGALNLFLGGLLQNNTNGFAFRGDVAGAIEAPHIDGMWFEANTSNIVFDTTTGSVSLPSILRTRMSDGTPLAYAGAQLVNFPSVIDNHWGGLAVTLASNLANVYWLGNNTGTLTDNSVQINLIDTSGWKMRGTGGLVVGAPQFGDQGVGTIHYASATYANGFAASVASASGVNLTSVRGISATQTIANNLRGTCTFAASGTCSVAFARNEPDASYFVATGCPVLVGSKAVSGFTMTATTSNSNACDWVLIH